MHMISERYDRNVRFFGKEGQDRLAAASVAIVGVGGLGTHVVQQLALLGVGKLMLIDSEEIEHTNFNRYIGIYHDDPIPGTMKVDIGERLIRQINPQIDVTTIPRSLVSQEAFDVIIASNYVFGCVDREGVRLILTELCAAYSKPYFDLSSDIVAETPLRYGGQVCVAWEGYGCLCCFGGLDIVEAQADLMNPEATRDRDAIYGISRKVLNEAGPSVVSINGVVASLGVTEFLLLMTGIMDKPRTLLTYRAHMGIVTAKTQESAQDCYYCKGLWGAGDDADVHRYLRGGLKI